jgi:hypothetical protein
MLEEATIAIAATPRAALFLAGKVFLKYRKAGGLRTGALQDFSLGLMLRSAVTHY